MIGAASRVNWHKSHKAMCLFFFLLPSVSQNNIGHGRPFLAHLFNLHTSNAPNSTMASTNPKKSFFHISNRYIPLRFLCERRHLLIGVTDDDHPHACTRSLDRPLYRLILTILTTTVFRLELVELFLIKSPQVSAAFFTFGSLWLRAVEVV
jgi:hypothetical protein